ncbi:MAG: hypothetical protein ACYTFN_22840 [Planctomycetota bacterium]|jgi:hypothetical protein
MIELLLTGLCYAGGIQAAFAQDDTAAVQRLYAESTTVADSLMALFRLVPLTGDLSLLEGLPDKLEQDAGGRELALLSAMWGVRAQAAGLLKKPKYGGRSIRLLEAAERKAPDDPWVQLVAGQSYLYRPGILGGGTDAAMSRFQALADRLSRTPECGLPLIEARIWLWTTLAKDDAPGAESLRLELLATDPAPRYRAWLDEK